MSEYILKLDNFLFLDNTETLIIFKIINSYNEIHSIKKITYQSNPLLDVELLNLRNKDLIYVIKKLHKIIINQEYKNKFITPLLQFKNELVNDFLNQLNLSL